MNPTRPQSPNPKHRGLRSLITGISGFVGQHLARHLVEMGEKVSGIDLTPAPESSDFSVTECDILDFGKLKTVTKDCKPEHVYHLAGLVHPKDSLSRPRDYYLTNVQGTVNLLEALKQNGIDARILIVSSSKVYGKVPPEIEWIDETLDPKPQTPYAMSKYLSEQVALQYFRNYGTQVLIARPFNHTGPGQPTGFVVPDFCKQITEIEALPPKEQAKAELHVGNLSSIGEFLDVRDVVRAYKAIVTNGTTGECFNVASGSPVRISKLLDRILALSRLVNRPIISSRTVSAGLADHHVGNNRKLQETTGWRARSSLKQTLIDTLAYWRQMT